MNKYRILWKITIYGESEVDAIDGREARTKADKGEDEEFKEVDSDNDWEVYDIIEID